MTRFGSASFEDSACARLHAASSRSLAIAIADVAVLRALETVPRRLFVPHLYADLAWRDVALPIACGQTMPEPLQVARMMEALRLAPTHRVLEVGAGSGYATAILSRLAREVVSIERFDTLATEAQARLRQLGVDNVRIVCGDARNLPDDIGVFDRALIDSASPYPPAAIMARMAEDGVVVFARATAGGKAVLMRLVRENSGHWRETELGPCRASALI